MHRPLRGGEEHEVKAATRKKLVAFPRHRAPGTPAERSQAGHARPRKPEAAKAVHRNFRRQAVRNPFITGGRDRTGCNRDDLRAPAVFREEREQQPHAVHISRIGRREVR